VIIECHREKALGCWMLRINNRSIQLDFSGFLLHCCASGEKRYLRVDRRLSGYKSMVVILASTSAV